MALVERYHTQEAKQFINGQPDEPQRIDDEPVEAGRPVRKAVSLVQSEERAKHVGILALEVYFPNIYVGPPFFITFHWLTPSMYGTHEHARGLIYRRRASMSEECPVGLRLQRTSMPWALTCMQLVQVSQDELEVHDKVAQGKYTLGLGQRCLAFCGDQEDVVSMSLTAVHSLLEKYDVDPKSIGRHVPLRSLCSSRALLQQGYVYHMRDPCGQCCPKPQS